MKKFLALVLALLMALSCISFAGAEETPSTPVETPDVEPGGNDQKENQDQDLPNGNNQTTYVTHPGKEHTPGEWTVEKAATCTEVGKKTTKCKVCGETMEDTIDMLKHTPKTETPVDYKAATCTEAGYKEYDECTVCGTKNYRVVEAALGHEMVRDTAKDVNATCTTAGSLAWKCSRKDCGYTETKTVDALGHYWYKMVWEYTNKETKTIKYVDAKPVGEEKIVDGEKVINDHNDENNPSESYTVWPTCKETGKNGHTAVCALCGTYYNGTDPKFMEGVVIPVVEHDEYFIEQFVSGYNAEKNTCTAGTYMKDGKLVVGEIEVVGKYLDYEAGGYYGPITYEYQPQTCENDGFVKLTCSTCGWTQTITIPKDGHKYVGLSVKYVDADGEVCDMVIYEDDKEIKMVRAANFQQLYLDKEVSTPEDMAQFVAEAREWWKNRQWVYFKDCTQAPIVQYICINSFGGTCENARVDAAGWCCDEHDFSEVVSYKQQKVNEQKVYEYTVEVTEGWEEKYNDDWNAAYEDARKAAFENIAECTDYTIVKKCTRCTQTTEVKKDGKGHELTKTLAVLEKETCSKTGLKAVQCELCEYNEVQTILPHKPTTGEADYDGKIVSSTKDKDKIVKNATCTEAGEMSHVCSKCGEAYTTVIPAAGHNWQHKITKTANCDHEGEEDYVCTVCGIHKDGYPKVVAQRHVVDRIVSVDNIDYNKDAEETGVLIYSIIDCTKDAKLTYYCKNCKLVVIEHKANTAHNWEKTIKVDLATNKYDKKDNETCLHNFEVTYNCTECQQTKTVTESEICKHVWAKESNSDKPTYIEPTATQRKCGEVGKAWYLCANCDEYYEAESMPIEHSWKTTWDAENNQWTYTCDFCGVEKTAVLEAPKYNVDLTGVTFGTKTTGTGKISLVNDTAATWILSTKYAYVRWTFKDAAGEDWVFDDVRVIDENGTFNANGIKAPAGASLYQFLVIITDDADADSMMLNQITRYGYVAK